MACPEDCPLCRVDAAMDAHYTNCAECLGSRTFPCPAFRALEDQLMALMDATEHDDAPA